MNSDLLDRFQQDPTTSELFRSNTDSSIHGDMAHQASTAGSRGTTTLAEFADMAGNLDQRVVDSSEFGLETSPATAQDREHVHRLYTGGPVHDSNDGTMIAEGPVAATNYSLIHHSPLESSLPNQLTNNSTASLPSVPTRMILIPAHFPHDPHVEVFSEEYVPEYLKARAKEFVFLKHTEKKNEVNGKTSRRDSSRASGEAATTSTGDLPIHHPHAVGELYGQGSPDEQSEHAASNHSTLSPHQTTETARTHLYDDTYSLTFANSIPSMESPKMHSFHDGSHSNAIASSSQQPVQQEQQQTLDLTPEQQCNRVCSTSKRRLGGPLQYQWITEYRCCFSGKHRERAHVSVSGRKRKRAPSTKVGCKAKFLLRKAIKTGLVEATYHWQHTGHDPADPSELDRARKKKMNPELKGLEWGQPVTWHPSASSISNTLTETPHGMNPREADTDGLGTQGCHPLSDERDDMTKGTRSGIQNPLTMPIPETFMDETSYRNRAIQSGAEHQPFKLESHIQHPQHHQEAHEAHAPISETSITSHMAPQGFDSGAQTAQTSNLRTPYSESHTISSSVVVDPSLANSFKTNLNEHLGEDGAFSSGGNDQSRSLTDAVEANHRSE